MSLSDRERRLLAEMEAALATDDPRLQTTLTEGRPSRFRTKPLTASLLIVAGISILFTGLIAHLTALGVAGFIVALGGVLALVRGVSQNQISAPRSPRKRSSLSTRLEQRWERRKFEG